jgi:hypothetical protein
LTSHNTSEAKINSFSERGSSYTYTRGKLTNNFISRYNPALAKTKISLMSQIDQSRRASINQGVKFNSSVERSRSGSRNKSVNIIDYESGKNSRLYTPIGF